MKLSGIILIFLIIFSVACATNPRINRTPNSTSQINFSDLAGCFQQLDEVFDAYLGLTREQYEEKVNQGNLGLDSLPQGEITGPLEFKRLYEEEPGHLRESKIPFVAGIIVYPVLGINGFDNHIPNYKNPKAILDLDFRDLPEGKVIKAFGTKTFLYSELNLKCRVYGKALLVRKVEVDGKLYQLTDKFTQRRTVSQNSDDQNDIFVLLGQPNKERWFDPINFYMARSIRVKVSEKESQRKVLTAFRYCKDPLTAKPVVGYKASISRENMYNREWKFGVLSIGFMGKLSKAPELCDGNFGQIESSYRSYRHTNISPLDTFCPWGGGNEVVEIQDNHGIKMSNTNVDSLLNLLGGKIEGFCD